MIGFVTMIINASILKKEIKKRKSKDIKFLTRFGQTTSKWCMVCGVFFGLNTLFAYINGICMISFPLGSILGFFQMINMGFYQLNRLHYCFASSQIYSNKGYSDCLYIVMYFYGCLLIIVAFIVPILDTNKSCGIDANWIYYEHNVQIPYSASYWLISCVVGMFLNLWDWITLFLYMFKVISLNKYLSKQNINVQHNPIM
eukprot:UN05962